MGETVQKKLSKKDIIKSYLIWTFFSHSTYNYERMQASGVLHAIAPSLEKLYGKDTQELREACERHMEFFNTEPTRGFINHVMPTPTHFATRTAATSLT